MDCVCLWQFLKPQLYSAVEPSYMAKLETMWMDGLLGRYCLARLGQVHVQPVWRWECPKNPSQIRGGRDKTRHESGEVQKKNRHESGEVQKKPVTNLGRSKKKTSRIWGGPKKTVTNLGRSKKNRHDSSISSRTRFLTGCPKNRSQIDRFRGWASWFCHDV